MAEATRDYRDYTVVWVCALEVEQAAARASLDLEHPRLPSIPGDLNTYRFGSIGGHNIVIACLPDGETGNSPAATVAARVAVNFPLLKFGLMVGVGGGVPTPPDYDDIRLGDVVVSSAAGEFGGVVQWDRGKTVQEGAFKRTGNLDRPPEVLRQAVTDLRATYRLKGSRLAEYVAQMVSRYDTFASPAATLGLEDKLFQPDYEHPIGSSFTTCDSCDTTRIIQRSPRPPKPVVHYGVIASGNQVIRNGLERDRISKELGGVLCFEMEAAGLMNTFPCLVIRGICDYSDSHKNKKWQAYAAAVAAAYTKELLQEVEPARVDQIPPTTIVMAGSAEDDQLRKLPYAEGAAMNSYSLQHRDLCLPGTRTDLLQQLKEWANRPQGKRVFWLNGMAGTGKSTIARTISFEFLRQNRLGASFFFSRGQGDRGHARKFFTTLALQLADTSPDLKRYICKAIADNQKIADRGLSEQWEQLIWKPLSRLTADQIQSPTMLLVVDALDECENQDDIKLIIRLLADAKDLQTMQLRVFVSSRPELSILCEFRKTPVAAHQDFILHYISLSVVEHDISAFSRNKLAEVRSERLLPAEWPGEQAIKVLTDRACGLFIYIATVCRFVGESRLPSRRLNQIIQAKDINQGPERNLDKIYLQILTESLVGGSDEQEKHELIELFRQIVGSIVVVFDALPVAALSELLSVNLVDAEAILSLLRSILDVPDKGESPIKLLHPSFRDFLLNKQRCPDERFWIPKHEAHRSLSSSCLQTISNILVRDICGLKKPGALAKDVQKHILAQYLPSHVRYACRYWVKHLQEAGHDQREEAGLFEMVQGFLEKDFLHWLEALALMGKMSEGILMITNLQSMLTLSKNPQLVALVQDAKRFILYNRWIVETAPLQVYISALIFSPKISLIRGRFLGQVPAWIKLWPIVDGNWSPSVQTLEGHTGWITSVVFSPDGQQLASGSYDGTIRLWDVVTGALQKTLEGHSDRVMSVSFSPDGRQLASGSYDETIRLWDVTTGSLQKTLEGHSDWVISVAFSPAGRQLVSGSSDKTIRLWDVTTGSLQKTLEGHSDRVMSVAFSPAGRQLSSGSTDKTIRLWNVATGALQKTLEGHFDSVQSVSFSPDGQQLASASCDQTIRLWDATTGALQTTFEGHSGAVLSVSFSPDGRQLASGLSGNIIQLWDVAMRSLQKTLEGHSDWVRSVAFSPDGQQLASASDDKTVRLWDALMGARQQTPEGHLSGAYSMASLSNGQYLASTSDEAVQLWDTATGTLQKGLAGHSGSVLSILLSPHGRQLASGSSDRTIRIWDATTGALQKTLEGHSDPVRSVAFSPDGRQVASASYDKTIRLWDATTGALQKTLEGHSHIVRSVSFSPDGRQLASGSVDGTIRLWDAVAGSLQKTLEGHFDSVQSVSFSPDGWKLASASRNGTIGLWGVATGALQVMLKSGLIVSDLSFTADGALRTDTGRIVLRNFTSDSVEVPLSSLYSLESEGSWIAWKGHNILWLPPEYRPACQAFGDDVIGLGCLTGRVTVIGFDPELRKKFFDEVYA